MVIDVNGTEVVTLSNITPEQWKILNDKPDGYIEVVPGIPGVRLQMYFDGKLRLLKMRKWDYFKWCIKQFFGYRAS